MALFGLGGVGKSQLAIEHAYRVRQNKAWEFWVYAETRARVEESFRAIADAVKIPGRNQPEADILQLVYQWLQNERNDQWLMVLDSADNVDVFYSTDEGAEQTTDKAKKRAMWTYLPQSTNGSILVTTRDKSLAFQLTGSYKNIIEVGPMDPDHALALLKKKLGNQSDINAATELVRGLEYMPLAISQAAAYIKRREPRCSTTKYLEEFRRSDQTKTSLLNYSAADLRRDRSASNSIITTWQISFDHIRLKRQSAAELLSLMSFFDRQGIPESMIRPFDRNKTHNREENMDNDSEGPFEEDIVTLRDYCLVKTNEQGGDFEMHGLVQLSTRKWLDIYGESEKFKKKYISRMAQAFPTGGFETWEVCQRLFPHVEKAIDYRPVNRKSLEKWALLLENGSCYSLGQGRYATAETMARKSRDTRQTVLGAEHDLTLSSITLLARIFERQGRWVDAEELYMQVTEIYKTKLGEDHPKTLTSMTRLAITYRFQGRLQESEQLLVQIMEIQKNKLGPDHPHTLISMSNLGSTYMRQGRWKDSEQLMAPVMEIRKTKLGEDHPQTLTSMSNLAFMYSEQGRWMEAEQMQVQVMEICKTKLGTGHPNALITMNNLAWTQKCQGRITDAIKLKQLCVQERTRVLGAEHPDTIRSLSELRHWRADQS